VPAYTLHDPPVRPNLQLSQNSNTSIIRLFQNQASAISLSVCSLRNPGTDAA
jgi:hypothetical protein